MDTELIVATVDTGAGMCRHIMGKRRNARDAALTALARTFANITNKRNNKSGTIWFWKQAGKVRAVKASSLDEMYKKYDGYIIIEVRERTKAHYFIAE